MIYGIFSDVPVFSMFSFAVDCETEKRTTDDVQSACSAGCGLDLKYKRREETIITILGEHGGRDDCKEESKVIGEFSCGLLACSSSTQKPGSKETRNYLQKSINHAKARALEGIAITVVVVGLSQPW